MEPPTILHVEDGDDDAFLFANALETVAPTVRLHRVPHGASAVEYLEGKGVYGDRSVYRVPDLILLDLRMPVMDGLEFLAWMNDSEAADIPVLCFSSPASPSEPKRAMELGALGVIEKPVSFVALKTLTAELILPLVQPEQPSSFEQPRTISTHKLRGT